eukprot:518313_1
MAEMLGGDYFSDGSSYNEAMGVLWDEEHDYEEDSEEFVLEEELPHEDDEYLESDSYEYPYPTSSDDSWAALSSDDCIQKIIEKLPTYSSESSGDDQDPGPPPLDPASDSDAGSFIEHSNESKTNDDIAPSQLTEYDPVFYLKSIEMYDIYVVSHSDEDPPSPRGQGQSDISPPTSDRDHEDAKEQPPQTQVSPQIDTAPIVAPAGVPVIEEAVTSPATAGSPVIADIEEEDKPPSAKHRGRDAPRKMTKTRIVIKKVKAKRAPKRFRIGMKVQIKNHMKYGGAVGIIRFVGVIEEEKKVGIELLDDAMTGETDGMYKEKQYFTCKDGSPQGVFVTIQNVKKYVDPEKRKQSDEFKKKSRERRRYQRNNAQMYGNIVDNLWKQRIDLVRTKKYRIVHKAGPREFGRIEYFGGDEEYTNALNDHTHWLAPRLNLPKRKGPQEKPKPKAGPREIGRKESFVGIVYDEEEEARKRAKRQQAIQEKKKRQFELARKKKLQEGAITKADGSKSKSAIKIKGKTKGKGSKTKNGSGKLLKSKGKKNGSRKNSKASEGDAKIKKGKKKGSGSASKSSRKTSDNLKKKGDAKIKEDKTKKGKKDKQKEVNKSSRKTSDGPKKKKKPSKLSKGSAGK